MFERAAVLQVRGNAGRAKSMTAGGIGQGGCFGPPLDHIKHVAPGYWIGGQLVTLFEAAE